MPLQAVAESEAQAQPADAHVRSRRHLAPGPGESNRVPACIINVGPGPGGVIASMVAPAPTKQHTGRGQVRYPQASDAGLSDDGQARQQPEAPKKQQVTPQLPGQRN